MTAAIVVIERHGWRFIAFRLGWGYSNPKDGNHGTFDNLFPSQHGLYGIMDFFSLQNIHDLHLAGYIYARLTFNF